MVCFRVVLLLRQVTIKRNIYEAILIGILLAKEMGAKDLVARSDSQLVTNWINGEY